MHLVLCEEGREIIQGRRVKSASAYTGTHGVSCPISAPFSQTTHHLAVVFSTFLEIPGEPRVDEIGVGRCWLPLCLQHPAQL